MNIEPNITLFLGIFGSVVTPMVIGGWAIYNRLANKIEYTHTTLSNKIEDVRKEAKEDRNYDRQEWKQEISKIDHKLDRLMEMFFIQNQFAKAGRYRHKPNKDVG